MFQREQPTAVDSSETSPLPSVRGGGSGLLKSSDLTRESVEKKYNETTVRRSTRTFYPVRVEGAHTGRPDGSTRH